MQVFKVNIPESVRDEISYYVDEIAYDSISNAVKWYQGLIDIINTLYQSPKRCPIADESAFSDFEIRHLIYGNYRILFRVENHIVEILHIKHTKMKRR